jgi:hypothetical protein
VLPFGILTKKHCWQKQETVGEDGSVRALPLSANCDIFTVSCVELLQGERKLNG